ncbi:MAG TPA: transketolase [Pirellulaceae bacterium]|nr:transketolase [Pirellulaceae bacterium]HMO92099.1 transketolase [Pirellulaceae bacterium]HMP69313.1 transketolase [Pirellulaceae bacterium]
MTLTLQDIQQTAINTIRTLSMDAVQRANSGHPGTPMALAPVAYKLWNDVLNYDPDHPNWPSRDRFVLSCGHASMLLYSVLHLAGVKQSDESTEPAITLDNIKNFRQLHQPCAGHPEFGLAAGIEMTTGPLGQGVATSVGMAMAAKWMDARYGNGTKLFDFNVYVLCSDGDMMEGVGCEAASLAGHLKLSNLCWIYDDNRITIEGSTDLTFSEQVADRFTALGWSVFTVDDANDLDAIQTALDDFKRTSDSPTLIIVRSIIGYGAPSKQNTADAHGAPLGEAEVMAAKEFYDWPTDAKFLVPDEVREHFASGIGARGRRRYETWLEEWSAYRGKFPEQANELEMIWAGRLPAEFCHELPTFATDVKGMATRKASGIVLNAVAKNIPWLLGGSADLAGSNNSLLEGQNAISFASENYGGRNLHFGVREHAMAAICNGLSLCGLRSYAATFFVFTDYMRPAMRLAALMKQPVLYILTHDSIGLGEDGPTHQPIEHLAACRAIPNLFVFRPADANEVAIAYKAALTLQETPAALVLSRQNLPTVPRQENHPANAEQGGHGYRNVEGVMRGGYVLQDSPQAQVIIVGTGSEVHLCLQAAEKLAEQNVNARVVSMPCFELFDQQPEEYRLSVLPSRIRARVAVEAGLRLGWDKYIGLDGEFVGMSGFGESAPAEVLFKHFGITVDAIVAAALRSLARCSNR